MSKVFATADGTSRFLFLATIPAPIALTACTFPKTIDNSLSVCSCSMVMAPIRVQSREYPASTNPRMKTKTDASQYVLIHLASATAVSREVVVGTISPAPFPAAVDSSPSPTHAFARTELRRTECVVAGRVRRDEEKVHRPLIRIRCFRESAACGAPAARLSPRDATAATTGK